MQTRQTHQPDTSRRLTWQTALRALLCVLAILAVWAAANACRRAAANRLIRRFEQGDRSRYADSQRLTREELAQYGVGDPARGRFVRCDLDGDGVDELLWNEPDHPLSGLGDTTRVQGIFACWNGAVSCIDLDLNDNTEYLFLGKGGSLVYTEPYYGTYEYENYDCVTLGPDRRFYPLYRLEIYNIYSMEELPGNWKEVHPDMAQPGIYCKKITPAGEGSAAEETTLSIAEFKAEYEALTGFAYESSDMFPI